MSLKLFGHYSKFVASLSDPSEKPLSDMVQNDVYNVEFTPLQDNPAGGMAAPVMASTGTLTSCQIAVLRPDYASPTVYANGTLAYSSYHSQVNGAPTYTGPLSLQTINVETLLEASDPAPVTLEIQAEDAELGMMSYQGGVNVKSDGLKNGATSGVLQYSLPKIIGRGAGGVLLQSTTASVMIANSGTIPGNTLQVGDGIRINALAKETSASTSYVVSYFVQTNRNAVLASRTLANSLLGGGSRPATRAIYCEIAVLEAGESGKLLASGFYAYSGTGSTAQVTWPEVGIVDVDTTQPLSFQINGQFSNTNAANTINIPFFEASLV